MHGRFSLPSAFFGLFLLGASWAIAQAPLPKDSPFLPGGAGNTATAPGETLEFAGVSTVGNKTDIIIHDKSTKKTRWIAMGATVDGVTAVSYDPKQEQAIVRTNGVEKTLSLRKPSGPINAPAPAPVITALPAPQTLPAAAPAPMPADQVAASPTGQTAPATPASPETIAQQETEARMLVSDLLEIGMAQRKAYEEAQRRAAEGKPPLNATPGQPGQAVPAQPGVPVQPAQPAQSAAGQTAAPQSR